MARRWLACLGTALSWANLFLLCLGLLNALIFSRIAPLTGIRPLADLSFGLYGTLFALGIACGLANHWKATALSLGISLLLLAHAWFHLYQPALRPGTINQDWLFPGSVSANYSFDQARTYLWHFLVFFFPALALRSSRTIPEAWKWSSLAAVFLFALLLNSVVALYQGTADLNFLAAGGGRYLDARRAIGLLEGGSAANIFYSSTVVGFFALVLFGKLEGLLRMGALFFLVLSLVAGANSSGRIFFVASGASVLILFLIKAFMNRKFDRMKNLSRYLLFAVLTLIALYFLAEWKLWKKVALGDWLSVSLAKGDLNDLLNTIDPVRANHWRTMYKAFIDHPVFGTGFGMFYANYFRYLPWALQFGDYIYADPPASLYLMLLSELGIVALLVFYALFRCLAKLFRKGLGPANYAGFSVFAFGWLLSLLISFLIGVHLIYMSVAAVFALILGSSLGEKPSPSSRRWLALALVLLVGGLCRAYAFAPSRPPEFNWELRGKPQIPLTIPIPIAAPGLGAWFQSGTELALQSARLRFFVEMPEDYYPLRGVVRILGRDGKESASGHFQVASYQLPKPGKTFVAELPADLAKECLTAISPKSFCSFQVETYPHWDYMGYRVGFFLLAGARD